MPPRRAWGDAHLSTIEQVLQMLGREKMSVAQMRAALDPPVKPARFHSIIRQMVRDGEIEVIEIVKAGPRIKNAPLYGLKRTSASDLDPETTPSTP